MIGGQGGGEICGLVVGVGWRQGAGLSVVGDGLLVSVLTGVTGRTYMDRWLIGDLTFACVRVVYEMNVWY